VNNQPIVIDVFRRLAPDAVHMSGLLGQRFDDSRTRRLHHQEEDHLLFPFRLKVPVGNEHPQRPWPEIHGDWQGEFMGTWVDAAVLSAWNAGDEMLREKITTMVRAWIAEQEPDGYLGTYRGEERWDSWAVWIQAHNLIGLISYFRYSGDREALQTAIKIADCVLANFGPEKRLLHSVGWYGGMANSAILEPLVWLYWETGDPRYLAFGRWLVDVSWEAEGGSHMVSALTEGKGVAGVAGGKGIEMLTNFAGLVELYRATGEERYLKALLAGWEDIVEHQLYITGSASTGEFFQSDYVLRNDGVYKIGEVCVSMGWMYLNFSLGRLTGEARFYDMAEQTIYNHLLTAQSPDGRGWAYYTGLRDHKRYRWHTDPECCPSRGVRALAHLPTNILAVEDHGLVVNLYEPARAQVSLSGEMQLGVEIETGYPFDGAVQLKLTPVERQNFYLRLRIPGWCRKWLLKVNGVDQAQVLDPRGYAVIQRKWETGDTVDLCLEMPVHVVSDRLGNPGRVAFVRGPLVYAADSGLLPSSVLLDDLVVALKSAEPANNIRVIVDHDSNQTRLVATRWVLKEKMGEQVWKEKLRYHDFTGGTPEGQVEDFYLVPFFDAGNRDPHCYKDGIHPHWHDAPHSVTYQVWLPYRKE
jgi:uncharacterized protein